MCDVQRLSECLLRWMGQRTMASAFAAWSDHTLQMHSAKQAMQQVAARLTNQQLSAAFYAWHQAAQQRRHALQSAHKILLRLQQGCKVMIPLASDNVQTYNASATAAACASLRLLGCKLNCLVHMCHAHCSLNTQKLPEAKLIHCLAYSATLQLLQLFNFNNAMHGHV